jgi:hypothetical protein
MVDQGDPSICKGTMAVPNTKGAANPGYCSDIDGRGTSFAASSCAFPSSGILKPSLQGSLALPTGFAGWAAKRLCAGTACSPADCCTSTVLLNEILPTPSSAADPEWVEIFNVGAPEGSLAGWTIEDGGGSVFWTGALGSTIGAGGYFAAEAAVGADALGDGGGTLVLRTADGVEMDRKEYASGVAADQVKPLPPSHSPHPWHLFARAVWCAARGKR